MKYLKFSLIILAFAVITDFVITEAASDYPVVSSLYITPHLDKNNGQFTSYRKKTKISIMSYNHISSKTALTNPCNDCKVAAKPFTEGGDYGSAVLTVAGGSASFTENTGMQAPGVYRLYVWRYDFTALTTYHTARWDIQPA